MPAQHAVAFLKFHIDPSCAAAFRPIIEIVQRVFEVKARPHLVGGSTAPLYPIFEGQVRRVLDPLGLLQRRSDDAAAAAGDGCCAAAFSGSFQNDRFASRAGDLNGGRNSRTATANDGHIRFMIRVDH